jgi:ribosomal protein L37E
MTIFCERCGYNLHPDHLYCQECGSHTPPATRKGVWQPEVIEHPQYCVSCSFPNNPVSLYCSQCGHYFFTDPVTKSGGSLKKKYCPSCGSQNSANAIVCYNCSFSLTQWFSQQGNAALKYGLSCPCMLKESMNRVSYRFINEKQLILGRDGAIKVPCSFVSSKHAGLDFETFMLADLGSTNGTLINRSPDRIKTVSLSVVSEFNLGGYFTFKIEKKDKLAFFHLTAILEEQECRRFGDPEGFDKLRSTYFIYPGSDGDLYIGKTDGKLTFHPLAEEEYWVFSIIDKFIYLTDTSNGIDKQLVIRKGTNLPKNWSVCNLRSTM